MLRTNFQFVQPDNPLKSILVTSSLPREGKTTSVSNLGISLAQTGKKVVIIDADLRKPSLHTVFNVSNKHGLSELLIGLAEYKDVVKSTQVENLELITSGHIPPNPSELIDSKRMKEVIRKLSSEYDNIVIDSPPALLVTDACLLSSHTDGVLLLVDMNIVNKRFVLQTKKILENAQAKIFGMVMSKVETQGYDYRNY